MKEFPGYSTSSDIARKYGVTRQAVYAALRYHPEIRRRKLGPLMLVNEEDYDNWQNNRWSRYY